MYAKYMESPKVYSKDERSEMFEYVNSEFFKLKGDKRKALRKAILTWKQNKQVGAFELFVMLYNSEDKYDEKNEWFKNYIKDENMEAYKNKKSIPYAKHIRRMAWRDEEINELEVQLENVLEDNKLISKSDHEEILDKVKKDNFEVNQSLEQKIQKLEKELQYTKDSCESKIRIAQDKASFFEKECNKLIKGD
tara:strand:- start:14 stop:592 length:579 start_codon:yes stop_codon:yes gene_type:complete